MRSHRLQALGDACLTDGLGPGEKYRAPVCDSHEYGWRVPHKGNGARAPRPAARARPPHLSPLGPTAAE